MYTVSTPENFLSYSTRALIDSAGHFPYWEEVCAKVFGSHGSGDQRDGFTDSAGAGRRHRHRTCAASAQNKERCRFCGVGTDRNLHDALGRVAPTTAKWLGQKRHNCFAFAFALRPSLSQRLELLVRILTKTFNAPRLPISSRFGNARPSPIRLIPWPYVFR